MKDEQIEQLAAQHTNSVVEFAKLVQFARALLASKTAVPWIAHWSGSNPYKGWSIRQGRDEVIWFGETISSETVEGIVLAHNKCFDCDGTGCVMNCSGLRPTAPAQSGQWVHCSPALIKAGVSCANTPRRACACDPENVGHDHFIAHITAPAQSCGDAEQADEAVTKPKYSEPRRLNRYGYCTGCKCRDDELDPCLWAHEEAQRAARAKDSK